MVERRCWYGMVISRDPTYRGFHLEIRFPHLDALGTTTGKERYRNHKDVERFIQFAVEKCR